MKILLYILIVFTMFACHKKDDSCDSSDFIGKWEVINNICSIDASEQIDILPGDFKNQIKLKLGLDTLAFRVTNCSAFYEKKDFLVAAEGTLELCDDEIILDYKNQALLFLQICKMTLRRQ